MEEIVLSRKPSGLTKQLAKDMQQTLLSYVKVSKFISAGQSLFGPVFACADDPMQTTDTQSTNTFC